jgi:hypothetical protein
VSRQRVGMGVKEYSEALSMFIKALDRDMRGIRQLYDLTMAHKIDEREFYRRVGAQLKSGNSARRVALARLRRSMARVLARHDLPVLRGELQQVADKVRDWAGKDDGAQFYHLMAQAELSEEITTQSLVTIDQIEQLSAELDPVRPP